MRKTALFLSSSVAGTIDRDKGIIRGVSVITEGEAQGHGLIVDAETLAGVKRCADENPDGVKVKVNHGSGFEAIVGALREFRVEGAKLLADMHLLKSHEMYDQILEIASSMPASVGLSISSSILVTEEGAARCEELYSADLVSDPAANPSGLFSAAVDSVKKGMAETSKTFLEQFRDFMGLSREVMTPVVELETKLKARDVELASAHGRINTLEGVIAGHEGTIAKHGEELKTLELSVEERASKRALEIAAGQGVPPKKSTPSGEPAAPAAGKSELKGFEKVKGAIAKEGAVAAEMERIKARAGSL